MNTRQVDLTGIDGELAKRAGKLINDLDTWIRALREFVPPSKPWQRALLSLVDEADGRMQILLLTITMG